MYKTLSRVLWWTVRLIAKTVVFAVKFVAPPLGRRLARRLDRRSRRDHDAIADATQA